MKFIQTKVIDELFLIFFINYFIIIFLLNSDFLYIIYDSIIHNFSYEIFSLFFFFFVIPKKKATKKKKLKAPIHLADFVKDLIFKIKLRKGELPKEPKEPKDTKKDLTKKKFPRIKVKVFGPRKEKECWTTKDIYYD